MAYTKTHLRYLFASLVAVLLLGSCGSPKRYAYLQNVEIAKHYAVEHENKILVRPGDRLRIVVQSAYPELVRPFNGAGYQNLRTLGGTTILDQDNTNASNTYVRTEYYGYEVDREGKINFPVLGYIKVEGLNREGVAKLLEGKLKEGKHIPDPKVDVMYSNFKIYLLGAAMKSSASLSDGNEVYNSSNYASSFTPITSIGGGVLRVSDRDELNILEALSFLGEMPLNANIEKVNVIRRENGQFVTYRLNLKSTDIFQSPGFYLKQEDIIYIEQLYRRSENEAIDRILQYSGYILTSLSSVLTAMLLLRRY